MISLTFSRSPRLALPALTLYFLLILPYQVSGSLAVLAFLVTKIWISRPTIHPFTPKIVKMAHAFFIMNGGITVRVQLMTSMQNPALIRPLAHRCLLRGNGQ